MFLLIGFSLSAFGQQEDEKRNPPPKKGEQPKVIIVPKNDFKPPKDNGRDEKPREDKRPKKPDEY